MDGHFCVMLKCTIVAKGHRVLCWVHLLVISNTTANEAEQALQVLVYSSINSSEPDLAGYTDAKGARDGHMIRGCDITHDTAVTWSSLRVEPVRHMPPIHRSHDADCCCIGKVP